MENYCKCKKCKYVDPTERNGYKWYCEYYRTYEDPDEYAVVLANNFLREFNNKEKVSIEKLNWLSEDMIEMAGTYSTKFDYESYKCLLDAAEETSYLYQGNKYPNELVEDLLRKQFFGK